MNAYQSHPDYDLDQRPRHYPHDEPPSHHHFRSHRPWSPAPVDLNMGDDGGAIARYLERQERGLGYDDAGVGWRDHRRRRQDPSDISVEALDLADYSQTHTSHPFRHAAFPPISSSSPRLPESYSRYPTARQSPAPNLDVDLPPIVDRPFSAQSIQSRNSNGGRRSIGPPPSLASARESLTASSTHHLITPSPRSGMRQLSLPPGAANGWRVPGEPAIFAASGGSNHSHHQHAADPDVRTFPKWSRAWYDSFEPVPSKGKGTRRGGGGAADDPFAAAGPSMIPSTVNTRSTQEADLGVWPPQAAANYSPRRSYPAPMPDPGDASTSSPLPWGQSHTARLDDPPEYISESVREERMRMLEREFGNGSHKGKSRMTDEDGRAMIGSVDPAGSLITDGPRRRAAVRWFHTLLACAVAVAGIYGTLAIHPSIPAPPANKPPAYVLYAFSVVTVLFTLWFYHARPCMRRRRRRKHDRFTEKMNPAGMMVLPIVQGLGGGGKKGKKGGGQPMPMMMGGGGNGKKAKKGKRGGPMPGEGVQVNLIVDPTMLLGGGGGRRRGSESHSEDDDGDEERNSTGRRGGGTGKPRRSVMEGFKLEEDWKRARKTIKWQMFVDLLLMTLWAATFFFVLWGKRCPIGGYNGWCTAYNTASAFSCLTSVSFAVGVYYDIRDLSLSKQSPRTRT